MQATFQQQLLPIKQAIQQGQFELALSQLSGVLPKAVSVPEQAEALYLQSVSCRLLQHYEQALTHLAGLLAIRPDYGRAYQEQAYCYLAMQQPKAAATAFYRATQCNPALVPSWRQLISIYTQQQQSQALLIANEQLAYLQGLPKPVLGGYDLMYEGELHTAEQVARRYLQQDKHHPDAMLLLAEIGLKLKVYHDAEFLLESCCALYPDNQRARQSYLDVLLKLGKFDLALEQTAALLTNSPDNTNVLVAKAHAQVGRGQLDEAISVYRQLLTDNPKRAGVMVALGHALKARGDIDAAITAYQQAAACEPEYGDAYWSLANTKTYRFGDDALARMSQMLAANDVGMEDRVHLHFALGKALEDGHRYAESFEYYAKGNELKRLTSGFDIQRTEQAMQAQIEATSATMFAPSGGELRPDPIFIVGLPRAGSTLLEQILASHPLVDGTMELHDIMGIASVLTAVGEGYPRNLASLSPEHKQHLGQQYLQQTQSYRGSAPFFIDKMPNNFIHIGLIKSILPNAKIIDARREPMACCFSGFKQLFGEGQEFSYGLTDIGRYYRSYEKLMAHWHTVLPGHILTVQHEDVIDDLEGQVKRILDFCGLPFDHACLRFYETERVIKTPSSEQVRQPINRKGMDQWKHFAPYLDELTQALDEYAC